MATRKIILHVDIGDTWMDNEELLRLFVRNRKWWYLHTPEGPFGPVSIEIEEVQD